jgi:excisionase family DNA binding protein
MEARMTIRLWTPTELAEACQVPLSTVRKWSSQGSGPKARRVGRHIRYLEADVMTWLDDQAKDDDRQSA